MNIVLWILQVLLAAQFLFHGWLFVNPPAELVDIMNAAFSPVFRIFLGIAELLAGVAMILPGITRMMTWATPLAAAGLMIVSGSASVYHLTRGETSSAIITAILFVMATVVAYMRWRVKPLSARSVARVNS
jgi:putative oxidoreductase